MKKYSTSEVLDLVGLSERALRYWIETDAIRPHVPPAGTGSRVVWTEEQVRHIEVLKRVREHVITHLCTENAFSHETAGQIWRALEEGRPWSFSIHLTPGGQLALLSSER